MQHWIHQAAVWVQRWKVQARVVRVEQGNAASVTQSTLTRDLALNHQRYVEWDEINGPLKVLISKRLRGTLWILIT
jgi:hypothetical protein